MDFHPVADLFPMMTDAELAALTADIEANGLRHPIVRYQGKVLDGRNRLAACKKVGVKPTFTDYEGDEDGALALVISLNVQRRDVTAAQRAIVAARALKQFPERRGGDRTKQPGKTSPVAPRSREIVAKEFKVSDKSVQQAMALLDEAPDLVTQVEACALSLAAAYAQHQAREAAKEQERKDALRKTKDAQRLAEYRDAVSNGDITLEQALQAIQDEARKEQEKVKSQADARQTWLKELVGVVEWVERFVGQYDDAYLAWDVEPHAPGWFEHGVTAERLTAVIEQVARVRQSLSPGEDFNGQPRGAKTRASTS